MTHDKEAEMSYRSGYYNACDGNGWQKQTTTLSVEDSEKRDAEARAIEAGRTRQFRCFKVGDVVRTRAEYEALPVGARVAWSYIAPVHDESTHYIERTADGWRVNPNTYQNLDLNKPRFICRLP